ncbi:unnamed protein product [Brassica napus]|uniref:(rape) hypothetical protein n=1 Tax=Brassica napus TaxID=3708 RepID=A0A816XYN0_BRANA|nr:unnamed protein product [Brassica napus]
MESYNAGDADEFKSGEAKIRKQKHDFSKLAFGKSCEKLEKPQEHKVMEKPLQRELMKILSP